MTETIMDTMTNREIDNLLDCRPQSHAIAVDERELRRAVALLKAQKERIAYLEDARNVLREKIADLELGE